MIMKKLLVLAIMALSSLSVLAYDAEIDGIYYNFYGDEAEVTYQRCQGYDYTSGYHGSVDIPSSVEYDGKIYNVTSIGDHAFYSYGFYNPYSLRSVTIPSSVTRIGDHAFQYCKLLTSIIIPESVTSIGIYAFYSCESLTSVYIPQNVTTIGSNAFGFCRSLTSVNIPDKVTSIESEIFSYCNSLTSITIPGSVLSIGAQAFRDCTSLDSVNILYGVTNIGNTAFFGCSGLTSITIPNSVTTIETSAFSDCGLTSIIIPNSVTSIQYSAFRNCRSLSYVSIPGSVTQMGFNAFEGCFFATDSFVNNSSLNSYNNWGSVLVDEETDDGLLLKDKEVVKCRPWSTSVIIPDGMTGIGVDAFSKCENLTSITIPPSLKSCSSDFEGCTKLNAIHISDLSTWCNMSFGSTQHTPLGYAHHLYLNGQEIKELVIPSGVTEISNYAFYLCYGLTSVSLPANLESIGKRAFQGCVNVNSVSFEGRVSSIDRDAFLYCGETANHVSVYISDLSAWCKIDFNNDASNPLRGNHQLFLNGEEVVNLIIPDNVTDIKNYTFYNCSNVNSITIPARVTSIGTAAFQGCSSLTSIVVELGNTKYDSRNDCNAIIETATNTLIQGCNNTSIPTSVTSISDNAFNNCYGLASITIPEGVTSIGSNAFRGCCFSSNSFINKSSLTSNNNWGATLYNGEETNDGFFIENNVVVGCRKSVVCADIPAYVTGIGESAFYDCSNLTSITIPASVTSIGSLAFYNCSNLTSVHIADISAWCNIVFSDNPLWYAHHLYQNGEEVTSLVIPDGVTTIGMGSFYGCCYLTSVSIPASVTTIGNFAFYECNALTDVWCYAENVPSSVSDLFSNPPIASATLHVPVCSVEAYKTTIPWGLFGAIVPLTDEDSIEEVPAKEISAPICYDILGRRITKPQKGLNIIGGRKVLIK